MTRSLAAAVAALLVLPAAASGHSTLTISGDTLIYASEDAISKNNLVVDETATDIHIVDRTADNGITFSDARCRAGDTDANGNPIEVSCTKTGLRNFNYDLGPNEDTARVTLTAIASGGTGAGATDLLTQVGPAADVLSGDQGNDTIDAGDGGDTLNGDDGSDTLRGGGGNDTVQAGAGSDTVEGGAGDDTIQTPDGTGDRISCGEGNDTVRADTVDQVGPDCENVTTQFVAPPPDQPAGDDKVRPRVQVGGSTLQRVSMRKRTIRIAATLSERGELSGSGFIDVGGLNYPLRTRTYAVTVAGGGATMKIVLSRRMVRRVLRDLRRRRTVRVRINVVGTDLAGNATVARAFRIRLSR